MCTCSKMNSICSKKSARAALNYSKGRSRGAYRLRGTICTGIRSRGEDADSSNQGSVCQQCTSLLDLRRVFDSLVHSGSNLKRRKKGYYKPPGSSYRNIKEQNNYLLRILFDGKGNYLYHRDCIRYAFKVSTSRLARLRRTVQKQSSCPFLEMPKEQVSRYSDVVLPLDCEVPSSTWLHSQPEGASVTCRYNPTRHGNAGKKSNNAKGEAVLKMFLDFVDSNSSPNGRREGSHGATYYFNPKFSLMRTPNVDDPQYEYKCNHSVLYELNRTLEEEEFGKLSVGTFHSWLKQHRPYVGICPAQSDYCDKCKEYEEEIARARQIANRLKQSGHSTEASIHKQEEAMAHFTALIQDHKQEAQDGLEYYKKLASETETTYKHICTVQQQQDLTPEKSDELKKLQETFSAFISADYMMGKNLPHWGESAQPSKTYYMMKLVCDVFGIVDHSSKKSYAYLCTELAAGPKSTDHTLTFLEHFVTMNIDKWVRHITLCLDNARICKNQYLVAWAHELVEKKRFDTVRFIYLTVGHTKFAPDKLFSSIAKTFYNSNVFCIEMLDHIVQQYATSYVFTSRLMQHWKTALEQKYSAISGITEMHNVLVVRKHGKVVLQDRKLCFGGEYSVLHNRKSNSEHLLPDLLPYEPVELSAEKFRHLREQHTKYIKQDVPLYEFPTFLQETQAATLPPITTSKQRKRYCAFPGCDGSGHIDPGRKRHLCERNCPLAAKKVAM